LKSDTNGENCELSLVKYRG